MAFCIRFKAILYILCFDASEKEHKTYLIDIIDQCCRYRVRARYPVVDWYKYDERRSGHLASVQSAFYMYDDWKQAERSGKKNNAGWLLGKLKAKY